MSSLPSQHTRRLMLTHKVDSILVLLRHQLGCVITGWSSYYILKLFSCKQSMSCNGYLLLLYLEGSWWKGCWDRRGGLSTHPWALTSMPLYFLPHPSLVLTEGWWSWGLCSHVATCSQCVTLLQGSLWHLEDEAAATFACSCKIPHTFCFHIVLVCSMHFERYFRKILPQKKK